MSNKVRQEHFAGALAQLEARLQECVQTGNFDAVPNVQQKIQQMDYVAQELAALSHGASLLSDRLAEWASELLESARS